MGSPYTTVAVADYNLNPPSDDGAQTPANEINWSKHKTKLGDPLKTAIEAINTNVGSAFGKVAGGTTIVSDDYTVLASDQGKLIVQTGTGKTITTPVAATVQSPFRFGVVNAHASGNLTLDGNASETIDGASSIVIPPGRGVIVETDGTNWRTHGQNWLDTFYTRRPIAGGYRNLRITVTSATAVDVDADAITLENSDGESYRAKNVDLTLGMGSTGANGRDAGSEAADEWYSVWVIYNPTTDTVAGLLVDKDTAEGSITMPSGYTFKARVGWVRNDGSSNLYRTIQKGNVAVYVVGTNPTAPRSLASGTAGNPVTGPTWLTVSVSGVVPPSAAEIMLRLGSVALVSASDENSAAAPNNSYGVVTSSTNMPPLTLGGTNNPDGSDPSYRVSILGRFMLESTNVYYASDDSSSFLHCLGWTDNL